MKKFIFLILAAWLSITANAQKYNETNSLMRKALVFYEKDAQGLYYKWENMSLKTVEDVVNIYAFDKKSKELYVETKVANVVILLDDTNAKIYKKSKSIPQLKGNDLTAAVNATNLRLAEKMERLNAERQRQIEDSIRKAKEDSIRKAREDSIQRENLRKQAERYRASHKWINVPTKGVRLNCSFCDDYVYKDSIFCIRMTNDSIFWTTQKEFELEEEAAIMHGAKIPAELLRSDKFRYHYEVFRDSLNKGFLYGSNFSYTKESIEDFNDVSVGNALRRIIAAAPYGFVKDYNWDSEYGAVSFDITYFNTNKKTIKYLDVYWTISNDVGDVRKTGHFKGTGPVEFGESGKWDWDYSSYYVAGDASKMRLTKIIITYMDGSTKVIPRNQIMYD